MVKVRAKYLGIFGQELKEPGTEFEVPDDYPIGNWMSVLEPIAPKAKPGPKPKAKPAPDGQEPGPVEEQENAGEEPEA